MITVMKRALPADLSRDIRRGRARSGGRTDDRSGAGAGGLAPGWKESGGRAHVLLQRQGRDVVGEAGRPLRGDQQSRGVEAKKGAVVAAVKR